MENPIPFVILGGAVLLLLIFFIVQYNGLVALRNHIKEAWSNIDTELKRRYELIPNLVSAVKGYAKHEREVLESVVELRNRCIANEGAPTEQAIDESMLVEELKRLLVVVESYPELKANQNFLALQKELTNTENRIQAARRFYNGNVRDYRNKCETFPSSIVARMFRFESEDYFRVAPAVREVPDVNL